MAKLYGIEVSANCLGPLALLKAGGVEHTWQHVNLMTGEQHQVLPALNPTHCVPTFTDDKGINVWESNAILRHIVRHYKLTQFEPTDEAGQVLQDIALDWRQTSFYKHVGVLAYPVLFGAPVSPDAEKTKGELQKDFEILSTYFLKDRKFIGGDKPTIADFAIVFVFKFIEATEVAIPDDLKAYIDRFAAAVPAYKEISASGIDGFVASKKK